MESTPALGDGQTSDTSSTEDPVRHHSGLAVPATVQEISDAVAIEDYDAVMDLLRADWFALIAAHSDELRGLFRDMPQSDLQSRPLLGFAYGLSFYGLPHHRLRSARILVSVLRAAHGRKRELPAIDRALIRASEAVAYRLLGRPRLGLRSARAAVRALDGLSDAEREEVGDVPRIYSQIGTSFYRAGNVDEALGTLEKGYAEAAPERPQNGFSNISMLAGIHAFRGDMGLAARYTELAREDSWTDVQRSMYPGTFYRLAEAMIALERFDTATAREHLASMVNDPDTIEFWVEIAIVEAWTELVDGRPGEAIARLDAFVARRGAEGRSVASRHRLAGIRGVIHLALGDADAASVALRHDPGSDADAHIQRARVALVLGRIDTALGESRRAAGVGLSSRSEAERLTIELAALLRSAPSARSARLALQLAAVLEHSGQRLALVLIPPSDLERVRRALADAGRADIAQDLPARSLLLHGEDEANLTEREAVVLGELVRTSSIKAVASTLYVSSNTVKSQVRSLYRKLGVTNREDAIAVARGRGLLHDGEL
ncbi:LuxR C-terminal-related transcriptional regulator [Microbacterium azadirachtae]|uniref:Putative transcriptional regulatory protein NarL n=1 Tax=Microbacterium azadirachtae TaxID=582680 RepID=A0A0F0LNB7_9MICO|nr:LuxR C-terminal-related transcriptional regulator [Microbacterium azadirachtae]KJL33750.1 putative transcriptional regulatory protein NarL [Microbacterium azadirachtae]